MQAIDTLVDVTRKFGRIDIEIGRAHANTYFGNGNFVSPVTSDQFIIDLGKVNGDLYSAGHDNAGTLHFRHKMRTLIDFTANTVLIIFGINLTITHVDIYETMLISTNGKMSRLVKFIATDLQCCFYASSDCGRIRILMSTRKSKLLRP